MKRLLCVTVVAAITAMGCTSAKKGAGKQSAAVDPSLKTKLLFALPDISTLTAGEKLASDVMTHYLFSIREVEGSCVSADKTHKALDMEQMNAIDSSVLTTSVPANCDYMVQLSLGVSSDTALADTTSKANFADTLKSTVDLKCATCHSGASPNGDVDLSTNAGVISNKVGMVSAVSGASMPPKSSPQLTSSEKAAFKTWQAGGYEMGGDSTATPSDSSPSEPSASASLDKVFYWNKTPLTISKAELQKFKTYSSVIVLSLTGDGKAAGFTTTTLKTIEEKSEGSDATVKDPLDKTPGDKIDTTTPASGVSYTDVQGIIKSKCVSCHPNQNQSDLSTYAAFMKRADSSMNRMIAGTMPKAGPLSASDIALLKKWQAAGYPEKAAVSTSKTKPTNTDTNLVEFHIPAGTGSSAWNSASDPVVLKVGQKLKIINDDSQPHSLYTGGQPCDHGNIMAAGGGSYVCPTTRSFSGELHDHLNDRSGYFYVKVTN